MPRKKVLKGGYQPGTGPLNEINLRTHEVDKLELIDNSLKKERVNLHEKVVELQRDKEIKRKEIADEAKENVEVNKLDEIQQQNLINNTSGILHSFGNIIIYIFYFIGALFNKIITVINTVAGLSNVGNGVLWRYLGAIIFILFCIFGIAFIIKMVSKTPPNKYNTIADNIMNGEFNNIINVKPPTFFSNFSNGLFAIVPDKYKYNVSSLFGSLSYSISGKDQYENYLQQRQTVENDVGRSDNIFNLNFSSPVIANGKQLLTTQTYSILKPKDIVINFDSNRHPLSDINKLDKEFISNNDKYFSTFNSYVIPITAPSSNWIADINNAYYSTSSSPEYRIQANSKNNIFKTNEKGGFILNSFQNMNYGTTSDFYKQNLNTQLIYINKYRGIIIKLGSLQRSNSYMIKYNNIISKLLSNTSNYIIKYRLVINKINKNIINN
jgi:hypothetical protein